MRKRCLVAALLGGYAALGVMAQHPTTTNQELTVDLNPVVVTGTGTHQRLKSTPAPVSVVTAADIKKAGITDFQQAMTMLVPSLSFSTNSMGSYLMMNGLSNKYVLILINGRKLIGDVANNIDLSRIDLSRVKRIEILNGAGSSLYGSDAIAGVINIITDEPKNVMQVSSSTRYEGYGQFTQSVNANIANEKFGSYTTYKHDQSDSWRTNDEAYSADRKGNISLVPTVGLMSTGFHSNLINQKFTYRPTDKLSLYANGGYYWKLTDRPVAESTVYGSSDYDLHYESYNVGVGGRYLLSKKSSITLDLVNDNYQQNYKYIRIPKAKNYEVGDYNKVKTQRFYEAEAKGIFSFFDNSQTVFGLDYRSESLDRPSAGVDKAVYTLAGYVQHEMKLADHFKTIAGARYDYHETAKGRLSPKLALMYSNGPINVRGTYSAGYRAPGLDELYYLLNRTKTITLGNTHLKPEHSQYVSLNVEYNANWLSLSATGYINQISNMISSVTTPFSVLPQEQVDAILNQARAAGISESEIQVLDQLKSYTNADKGLIKGFEINALAKLFKGFSLSGNYAYAYARNKIDEVWDNVPRSIRHTGTVAGNYTHNWNNYQLNLNLNGRFQSKRFHPGHSYGDAPGYGIWNLNTKHTFTGLKHLDMELGAGINNLLNKIDERPYGVNYALLSPGRTAYVSLTLKLNK